MRASISFIPQILIKGLLPAIVLLSAAYGIFAQRTTPVGKGEWGGTGIAMTVTDTGATIQFDCAAGTITKQMRIKRDGSFIAEGTLTRNGPGPVRRDSQPIGRAVIYKGKVNRRSMSLTVTDAKTGEKLSDHTLTAGGAANLHRCY